MGREKERNSKTNNLNNRPDRNAILEESSDLPLPNTVSSNSHLPNLQPMNVAGNTGASAAGLSLNSLEVDLNQFVDQQSGDVVIGDDLEDGNVMSSTKSKNVAVMREDVNSVLPKEVGVDGIVNENQDGIQSIDQPVINTAISDANLPMVNLMSNESEITLSELLQSQSQERVKKRLVALVLEVKVEKVGEKLEKKAIISDGLQGEETVFLMRMNDNLMAMFIPGTVYVLLNFRWVKERKVVVVDKHTLWETPLLRWPVRAGYKSPDIIVDSLKDLPSYDLVSFTAINGISLALTNQKINVRGKIVRVDDVRDISRMVYLQDGPVNVIGIILYGSLKDDSSIVKNKFVEFRSIKVVKRYDVARLSNDRLTTLEAFQAPVGYDRTFLEVPETKEWIIAGMDSRGSKKFYFVCKSHHANGRKLHQDDTDATKFICTDCGIGYTASECDLAFQFFVIMAIMNNETASASKKIRMSKKIFWQSYYRLRGTKPLEWAPNVNIDDEEEIERQGNQLYEFFHDRYQIHVYGSLNLKDNNIFNIASEVND